jgi:hypothetical protein
MYNIHKQTNSLFISFIFSCSVVILLILYIQPDDEFLTLNRSYFTNIIKLQAKKLLFIYFSIHKLFIYLLINKDRI